MNRGGSRREWDESVFRHSPSNVFLSPSLPNLIKSRLGNSVPNTMPNMRSVTLGIRRLGEYLVHNMQSPERTSYLALALVEFLESCPLI